MRYQVQSGRPVEHNDAAELDAVQWALRRRDDGLALAVTFDPGDAFSISLTAHAVDILLGLTYLRGWRDYAQEMRIALATDWTDRWWDRPLGPGAFVVESDLARAHVADVDDITRIIKLTTVAWCMERDLDLRGRPTPDLMTAFAPGGLVLANIHPEPLHDATRAHYQNLVERMPSLPERGCAFATASDNPGVERVFVALEDTSAAPRPEIARALLRLMLASRTDD